MSTSNPTTKVSSSFSDEDEEVAAAPIPVLTSSTRIPRTSSLSASTNDDVDIRPYIGADSGSISVINDDEDDEAFGEYIDDDSIRRQTRRAQRHRRPTVDSKMVSFVDGDTQHHPTREQHRRDDNTSSTMTNTGTFSDRIRRLRNNFLSKLTHEDYSHKYSIFGGPVDRWNRCYLSFCFLGCCTLLPWNFFMSADAYWKFKFRNVTDPNDETDLQVCFFKGVLLS